MAWFDALLKFFRCALADSCGEARLHGPSENSWAMQRNCGQLAMSGDETYFSHRIVLQSMFRNLWFRDTLFYHIIFSQGRVWWVRRLFEVEKCPPQAKVLDSYPIPFQLPRPNPRPGQTARSQWKQLSDAVQLWPTCDARRFNLVQWVNEQSFVFTKQFAVRSLSAAGEKHTAATPLPTKMDAGLQFCPDNCIRNVGYPEYDIIFSLGHVVFVDEQTEIIFCCCSKMC